MRNVNSSRRQDQANQGVVEGQSNRPHSGQQGHDVDARRLKLQVHSNDQAVNRRGDRPQSVRPGILPCQNREHPADYGLDNAQIQCDTVWSAYERMIDKVEGIHIPVP